MHVNRLIVVVLRGTVVLNSLGKEGNEVTVTKPVLSKKTEQKYL